MAMRHLAPLLIHAALMLIAPRPVLADEFSREQIAALAEQLGDKQFDVRQAASKQLLEIGEPALPVIRSVAARTRHPEIRFRAWHVIYQILRQCRTSQSTGIQLAIIPRGEFMMGSPPKEPGRKPDELLHRIQITDTFLLGTREVNQSQYLHVMESSPSHFTPLAEGKSKLQDMDTGTFPVERVSWFDAIDFCNRLSRKDGYPPYYQLAAIVRQENSIMSSQVSIQGGNGYRLPTEAEWEYACRASTTTRFHFGFNAMKRANLIARSPTVYGSGGKLYSLGRTTATGTYPPNGFGLFDMHGNVAEWCWDWYDKDHYSRSLPRNPAGPRQGVHRVVRGGSWLVNESSSRAASRFYLTPRDHKYFVGFRVARTP